MTRRACRLTVLTAFKALQADLQGSSSMAGPFAKNSFLQTQRLQQMSFSAPHVISQTSTPHCARRTASGTARREIVAALVNEPIRDLSANRGLSARQLAGFSSNSDNSNGVPKPEVAANSTPPVTAKAVKTDRRPGRRLRESQSKDSSSNTDLRMIQGVGPKNEQLLLKTGHSSVAKLKEVYKVDHREDKIALKRYLQVGSVCTCLINERIAAHANHCLCASFCNVWQKVACCTTFDFTLALEMHPSHNELLLQDKVGIRPHHCTVIATDIKEKVDQELAEAGGPSTSQQPSRVTLCVEGNISAGKSTFLNWVAQGHPELDGLLEVCCCCCNRKHTCCRRSRAKQPQSMLFRCLHNTALHGAAEIDNMHVS